MLSLVSCYRVMGQPRTHPFRGNENRHDFQDPGLPVASTTMARGMVLLFAFCCGAIVANRDYAQRIQIRSRTSTSTLAVSPHWRTRSISARSVSPTRYRVSIDCLAAHSTKPHCSKVLTDASWNSFS